MAHPIRNAVFGLILAALSTASVTAYAQDSMSAKPGDAMKSDKMATQGGDAMKKNSMSKDTMGSGAMKKGGTGSDAMGKKTNDTMSPKKM